MRAHDLAENLGQAYCQQPMAAPDSPAMRPAKSAVLDWGVLAGRKDLVHAARLHSKPHSDSLGRPMKAGREEMTGLWLACEKYAKLDFEAMDRECHHQAEFL